MKVKVKVDNMVIERKVTTVMSTGLMYIRYKNQYYIIGKYDDKDVMPEVFELGKKLV